MFKQVAERAGHWMRAAKGNLSNAYQFGLKVGGAADTAHRFSKTMLDILHPHIGGAGQTVQKGIGAYENLRSQVQQQHAKAVDVAGQIQKRALPQLQF